MKFMTFHSVENFIILTDEYLVFFRGVRISPTRLSMVNIYHYDMFIMGYVSWLIIKYN